MKVYCLCVDAFPKTPDLEKIASVNGLSVSEMITNGMFTTTTLNSIFMGSLPSDRVDGGITYHTWMESRMYEWKKVQTDLLDQELGRANIPTIIHNHIPWIVRNLLWRDYPEDKNIHYRNTVFPVNVIDQMKQDPMYRHITLSSSHPDGSYEVFRDWDSTSLRKEFYDKEKKYIAEIQSLSGDLFFFTDLCHWHEAAYHANINKQTAKHCSYDWLQMWDFSEPDSVFIVFADHGYQCQEEGPPKDYLTWMLFRDNTQRQIKPNAIVASADLYYTILNYFGVEKERPGFGRIDMQLDYERIFLVEDIRGSNKTNIVILATAVKIVKWYENTPQILLQVSYHRLRKKFYTYLYHFSKNNPYNYSCDCSMYTSTVDVLKNKIFQRFKWLKNL